MSAARKKSGHSSPTENQPQPDKVPMEAENGVLRLAKLRDSVKNKGKWRSVSFLSFKI